MTLLSLGRFPAFGVSTVGMLSYPAFVGGLDDACLHHLKRNTSLNDGLIDLFNHNAWASRRLLAVCTTLTPDQWHATVAGTYGTIFETMRHYLSAEAGYLRRLSSEEPSWDTASLEATPADFALRIDELDERWMRFLSIPFDAERVHVVRWHDHGSRDVPAGIVLAQAIHHGNEHRSQIATILTQLGITPPEWGLWEYAEDTDRAPRTAE